ncbi:MAG: hypothetical protein KZQ82_19600 [Candidatus Thiodiazotropha sp. (ex Lucinoma annulata)]|nr:hypothetical protein [Candidatus Thiodiazotropha sp. (ex Lucinoma annulata)]
MKESVNYLWMALLALQLTVQGCGGGGGSSDNPTDTGDPVNNDNPVDNTSNTYTGSESQAVVSEASAQDLAITAASGVKQAVDENGMQFPMQTAGRSSKSYSAIHSIQPMVFIEPTEEMQQETTEALCPHGGQAIIETIEERSDSWLNVFVFNNCGQNEGIYYHTITGTMSHTYYDTSSAFTDVYSVSLTLADGTTRDINKTISCDANFRCNNFSDYSGYDGRLYRETDVSVTEEGNSAYTASGRIYDPYHGYIDVTTEIPFTLDCPDDRPGAGRLSFTGANQSSGSIEFISCTEYVVITGNGTSNTYSW